MLKYRYMKVFFDARFIRTDYHDGISRYGTELGNALAKLTDVTFLICDKAQLNHLPKNCSYQLIHRPTSFKESFTPFVLNRLKPDVVFSPMQTMGLFGRRYKLILTLHDMIYYHYRKPPTSLNPILRAGWWLFHSSYAPQRLVLNGADAVATVSETSKQEIVGARLTKRPVVVIANAPNNLRKYLKKDVDISQPPKNLIYMGSFMPYKNVETLIKGMKHLPDHTLHLLSRITPKRQDELQELVGSSKNVIFHGGVSDEEYAKLLADRALQVSASLIEGYGLPIAEAMTLSVPSVISNMPIFHEVGGEGALYFDSQNPEDFASKIKEASKLDNYQALSKKSKDISKKFSWESSAKVLLKTMQDLVS